MLRMNLVLILQVGVCLSMEDLPEIGTPLGRLKGYWKMSLGGRKHAAFEGIPYSKPPVGELRFEEPQPVLPWSGTWEANALRTCMQGEMFALNSEDSIHGEEDCLYLNVYTPAEFLNGTRKIDVIVSIHGGGFMVGSGHMFADSRIMMDKDIVLVSINYRLGILGFLSTEDDVIPGNIGMKDQVMALKWVRDNIAAFGGNPHSVTIVGLSAGGVSVHLHYLSPLSRGLFIRGMSQSGTALAPWAVRSNPLRLAKKLATLVGCDEDSTSEMKKCLKERPAHHLLRQLKHFYPFGLLPFAPFTPVVEKSSWKAFLDKEPYQLLKEGNVYDVPWITSFATDDGLLPAGFFWSQLDDVNENWAKTYPYVVDCNDSLPISNREVIPKKILDFYLGVGKKITKKTFKRFTQMLTDRLFAMPAEVSAKMQAKATKSKVYFYVFNYNEGQLKLSHFYTGSPEVNAVAHAEDAIYFYGLFYQNQYSKQDEALKDACQNMLYSYVSKGKPSFDGTYTWQPIGSSGMTYVNVTGPRTFRLQWANSLTPISFWSELGLLKNTNIVFPYREDVPEVETPLGKVRGFWKTSLDGRKYASFEGIPYAQPPVGDLRFEEPHPITPWQGTWVANNAHTCIQNVILNLDAIIGVEDCLYLNVYVPAEFVNKKKNLEVVVSIHGGGFLVGSGHALTKSEFFMDRDIILVSINYRLGIFGFLSTEDHVIPGNNGLKDQSLALRWIKDNIAAFSGNPKSITTSGVSAGGASVHFHYFSPLSKGLFNRGLSQSGTVLCPWVIKEKPLENAKKLAVLNGCPDSPSRELKKCLKQRPAQNLMGELKHFFGYGFLPLTPFGPVVERGSIKPFLDKNPYLLLKEGKVLDVPWITSHVADDGLLPTILFWDKLDTIDDLWTKIAPYLLDCNHTLPESRRNTVFRAVLDHYVGSGGKINRDNFKKFTQMFTDRYFAIPTEVSAKMQAKVTQSPVYYYVFNYKEGENKAVEFLMGSTDVEGVSHGEDGIYLQGFLADKPFSDQDKILKNAFHDMLYSFASTGKPSFDGTEYWQPTSANKLTYLNITGPRDMKLQTVEKLTPIDFWDRLELLVDGKVNMKDEL